MTQPNTNLDYDYPILDLTGNTCDYLLPVETERYTETSKDLHIMHLNIRGLIGKQRELSNLLFDVHGKDTIDAISLNETWLTKKTKRKIKIPNYTFIGKQRSVKRGGGVGFLIHKNQPYRTREDLIATQPDSMEYMCVELKTNHKNIILLTIYRPPNTPEKEFLKGYKCLIDRLKQEKNKDHVLCMDHNLDLLKHELHKNTSEFLNTNLDQNYLPTITRPTRITNKTATLIDNIIINNRLEQYQKSCILISDLSDHFPCLLTLKGINKTKNESTWVTRRQINDKIIDQIKDKLTSTNWKDKMEDLGVDDAFDTFHEHLQQLLEEHAPEKSYKIPDNKIIREPWLIPGILKCIKKQKNLYQKFIRDRTECNHKKYLQYRRTLQRVKRNLRNTYYLEKCTEYRSETRKLWKLINEITHTTRNKTTLIECIKVGNIKYYNPKDITNELGQYFSTVGKRFAQNIPAPKQDKEEYLNKIPRNPHTIFLTPVTESEIRRMIKNLKNKNSTGYDNISNRVLKALEDCIIEPLVVIFNKSLSEGKFPDRMKLAEIVPLHKGKSQEESTNYRPISLLVTISKLLEKIMYTRTYTFLENTNQIYNSQYGFRSKHSCETAIQELVGQILKNTELKNYTISVYLDLSKAFDTLEHEMLLSKLEIYGIRGIAHQWFTSYLHKRSLRVKCNTGSSNMEYSDTYPVEYGTPQGSCLGPLLFLIFTNDLYRQIENSMCLLFADDTTLYQSHRNIKYLAWEIEQDLIKLNDWFKANKLTLNLSKTNFMVFSPTDQLRSQIQKNPPKIEIEGKTIELVHCTKFLGAWIDDKLTWNTHISILTTKLKRNIHLLQVGQKQLSTHALKMVYYAQIYSHIQYCVSIWGNMIAQQELQKLQRIQNKCIRLVSKRKNSPNNVQILFDNMRIINIGQLIKLENSKLGYKVCHNSLPPTILDLIKKDSKGNTLNKTHKYATRQKKIPNLPRHHTTKYNKSFLNQSLKTFSELDKSCRESPKLSQFIQKVKSSFWK